MGKERLTLSRRALMQAIAFGTIRSRISLNTIGPTPDDQLSVEQEKPKSIQNKFLEIIPEELTRFVKDPQGNMQERKNIREKIDQLVPLFAEKQFYNLSKQEIQADLEMYFDMYWAGWEKYQIPWSLLWIIHIHESRVSRDIQADKNGDGALQVIRAMTRNPAIQTASDGYRTLEERTQRFSTRGGKRTTDSDEILYGSAYIRVLVNEKKYGSNDEEAVLKVVTNNYSARVFGEQRVAKYRQVKKILETKESLDRANSNVI